MKVDSRLVVLDLSVTDSKGEPVLNLRPDEVRVYEDGRPQTVRSFDPPAIHAMPPGSTAAAVVRSTADLAKIGQAPVTVLVLDELNMGFSDESYARQKLAAWLSAQPAVLPQPAALMAVTYKNFEELRDYTQDRDALLQALKAHHATVPWRKYNNGTLGAAASETMFASLGALEQIAQSTRGIAGRKNLIWVGDGFPSISTAEPDAKAAETAKAYVRRITNAMLQARVTLSILGPTLKPYGMVTVETQSQTNSVNSGAIVQPATEDLQFASLAPSSGGRAYANRNDLDREIGESVDTGVHFYTLSYTPTEASNDPKQFRRIRVEILRPGLTAQTRDGYFAEPDKPEPPTRQQLAFDLYGAAESTLQYTDLHVRAEHTSGNLYALRVDAGQMTWSDQPGGKRHADTIVLAVCFSAQGRMLSRAVTMLGSETSSAASLSGASATLETKVTPPPGTARIRFVLRDAVSGRLGTTDVAP